MSRCVFCSSLKSKEVLLKDGMSLNMEQFIDTNYDLGVQDVNGHSYRNFWQSAKLAEHLANALLILYLILVSFTCLMVS